MPRRHRHRPAMRRLPRPICRAPRPSSVALSTGLKSFSTQSWQDVACGHLSADHQSDANPSTHYMVLLVTAYTGVVVVGHVCLDSLARDRAPIGRSARPACRVGSPVSLMSGRPNTAASDPTAGKIKVNAAPGAATALYISETDGDGNALGPLIATWDDSTSTPQGAHLYSEHHGADELRSCSMSRQASRITERGTPSPSPPLQTAARLADGAQVVRRCVPERQCGRCRSVRCARV